MFLDFLIKTKVNILWDIDGVLVPFNSDNKDKVFIKGQWNNGNFKKEGLDLIKEIDGDKTIKQFWISARTNEANLVNNYLKIKDFKFIENIEENNIPRDYIKFNSLVNFIKTNFKPKDKIIIVDDELDGKDLVDFLAAMKGYDYIYIVTPDSKEGVNKDKIIKFIKNINK